MPEFLCILRPTRADMLVSGPSASESAVVAEHFAYLKGLCEKGEVVMAGRTTTEDERVMGLVVLHAADAPAAQRFVENDPAVAKGVMRPEVLPFRVAMLTGVR